MMPANAIKRHVVVEERMKALSALAETTPLNTLENNGSKIGVICAGIAYMYAKEALGDRVDYYKLGMVYPLPEQTLRDFAAGPRKGGRHRRIRPLYRGALPRAALRDRAGGQRGLHSVRRIHADHDQKVVFGEEPPACERIDEALPMRPPGHVRRLPAPGHLPCAQKAGVNRFG